MCSENILHLYKIRQYLRNYQGFKELEYVDLVFDLQIIATCKDSKNVDLQLDLKRTTT